MIDGQLKPDGVIDERILEAFAATPREIFVEDHQQDCAYIDEELTLSCGRFLLSPSVLGRMVQAAAPHKDDMVLDIGAATGYSTAILARLTQHVISVVEPPALVEWAQSALVSLGINNATVVNDPLYDGYAANGPYNLILINGAIEVRPEILFQQLHEGGRLLAISREKPQQSQVCIWHKQKGKITQRIAFDAFCPIIPAFQKRKSFTFV